MTTKPVKSRSTIIENQFFGEGYFTFALPILQIERLQELTDMGPMELFEKIAQKRWKYQDIAETIRLGLIGGGTDPKTAYDLTQTYVLGVPLAENVPLALLILSALLYGVQEEGEEIDELDIDDLDDDADVKKN